MDHLSPIRRMFRMIGVALTVVSAALTGLFGLTMASNWIIALVLASGLMLATVASAYVWPFVAQAFQSRNWITAGALALFGVLVTTTDLTTNFGAIGWQRGANVTNASVQNARYDMAHEQVQDAKANLKMWRERLASLKAQNAWITTINAEAMRGQIPALDEAIRQEAARIKCGQLCLGLKQKKAALMARIAKAEEVESLRGKIEAAQRVIDKKVATAATQEKAQSGAWYQTMNLASMATFSLEPSKEAQHWTDKGVNWMVAAFFAFGAMGSNFLGWHVGRSRREEDGISTPPAIITAPTPEAGPSPNIATAMQARAKQAAQPVHTTNNFTIKDETLAAWARDIKANNLLPGAA